MLLLHSALKKFGLRQQILLGFLSVIVLSMVVAALNIYQQRDFHLLFKQHQQLSGDTNNMLEVDANIAQLQRLILAYSTTARASDVSGILALHDKISQQISSLAVRQEAAFTKHETLHQKNQQLLKQLEQQVGNLREKIEQLQGQRTDRASIVNDSLFTALNQTDIELHRLYDEVIAFPTDQAVRLLWMMQHNLASIQTHSAQYFSSHEFRDKQIIQRAFTEFKANVVSLQKNTVGDDPIDQSKRVMDALIQSEDLFHAAVQADRNYLFLINIVIAGETTEIASSSDELKQQFLLLEYEMDKQAEYQSSVSERLTLSASIAGSFVAILIAFLIGRKISLPILSITNTFTQLAKGDSVPTIPGIERTDEIGQLAKAANVFRETNKRTQDLLEQTERFAGELKQRELALEQAVTEAQAANLSKSQFLANMSHELRTPMNAILGMLALLKKTLLNDRQFDYAQKSEMAARTLLGLLNDILDLSKAEAGKIELDPTPFNIDQLLANLTVILAPLAAAKGIALNVEVAPDLPRNFLGDTLRLQQILINLGSNAIKFTHRGSVTISIHPGAIKNNLLFSISDTGIGVAPENREKIFTAFTQAEASTTRRYGGTGLGLAISQRLIALMGGDLRLNSELNKGSCFYFTLDLPETSETDVQPIRATPDNIARDNQIQHLSRMNILLVEDNPTNQQIAQELLESEGATITTANDGQEAVNILSRFDSESVPFDAVLMDIQMPVMDGLSAAQVIRQTLNLHHLPIIAMTANVMASDREASLKAGMNDHVGKPFDINQLVKVLCSHTGLGHHHSEAPVSDTQVNMQLKNSISGSGENGSPVSDVNTIHKQSLLDIQSAIYRMGGNRDIYLRMAPKFIQNMESLPDTLRLKLEQRDYYSLHQSFHSLKGISSTFGFKTLAEAASVAEKRFKQDIEFEQAADLINEVCDILALSLKEFSALE